MTKQDIDKLKQDITEVVADELLAKVLGISVLVINDHFSDLIRLEVDGKNRAKRFTEQWWKTYKMFEHGRLTLEDIRDVLREESDIVIKREK